MKDIYALICGCNYGGTWTVYQSENDAKKFYDILTNIYKIKNRAYCKAGWSK